MAKRIASKVHYEALAHIKYPVSDMGQEVIEATHTWFGEVIRQNNFQWENMGGMGEFVNLENYTNDKVFDIAPLCGRSACRMNVNLDGGGIGNADEVKLEMRCGTLSAKTNDEADAMAADCRGHYEVVRDRFVEWISETAVGIKSAHQIIDSSQAEIRQQQNNLRNLA